MVTDKIKELQDLQAKAAELQKAIDTERQQELAALPGRYGFDSVEAFIKAVRGAAGGRGKKRGRKAKATLTAGKRGRTKITPELKGKVIAAVQAGKTGAAVAKEFGISLPSVQNIKKEAGLVKPRSSDAAPESAAAPAPAESS
jgi:transposase-like protein